MPINDGAGGNLADTFGRGNMGTFGGNPSTSGGSPTNGGGWQGGGFSIGNWNGAPNSYGQPGPFPGGYATPVLQSPVPGMTPPVNPYTGLPMTNVNPSVPPTLGPETPSLLGSILGDTISTTPLTDSWPSGTFPDNPPTFSPPTEDSPWGVNGYGWPTSAYQDWKDSYPGMTSPFSNAANLGVGLLGMNNPGNMWGGFSGLGNYADGTNYSRKADLQR